VAEKEKRKGEKGRERRQEEAKERSLLLTHTTKRKNIVNPC